MSISTVIMSFPKPAYYYSAETGLVKYVCVDFTNDSVAMQDEEYKTNVFINYPFIEQFIKRQFQRICFELGIKCNNDDIQKITSDYILFCKRVGYVEPEKIIRTEEQILDFKTKTASYDEKIEKWLRRFLSFLVMKNEKNNFIHDEKTHNDLMFSVAVYIMASKDVVLYLCGNCLMIEKISQTLDCVHQFMMDELTVDEITEVALLRKETANLIQMIRYNVEDAETLKTFIPSDKDRFFMKYPDNVYSKFINDLKKNHQYDHNKYTITYFIGKNIGDTEHKPMFNMFGMPLVSTINKTEDEDLKEDIASDYAWSKWMVKFEDEFAKHPDELERFKDTVKPTDYIHINPIFRYK